MEDKYSDFDFYDDLNEEERENERLDETYEEEEEEEDDYDVDYADYCASIGYGDRQFGLYPMSTYVSV